MIITIDGPAGSGKSSVAKKLAKKLNFYCLYTGLLYRAVAYLLINKYGKRLEELGKLDKKELEFIKNISYEYENNNPKIIFEGQDLTNLLQETSLSQPTSILSAKKEVRNLLLNIQRNVAKKYDIVTEGRDCGSVLFPNADYKFYLTANLNVRAKRIYKDKIRGNSAQDFEKVKVELEQRDLRDKTRKVAPLIIPKNATIIDNSNMSQEETVKEFLKYLGR